MMAIGPAALAKRAGAAGARQSLVGRCDLGATVPETLRFRLPGKAVQHQSSQSQQQVSTHELGPRGVVLSLGVCGPSPFALVKFF
jgi:hypothetical protein